MGIKYRDTDLLSSHNNVLCYIIIAFLIVCTYILMKVHRHRLPLEGYYLKANLL